MIFQKKAPPVQHPPLKGVNLGGWLVLEKWITPGLFAGTEAIDEYNLCHGADLELQARLRQHRDSFVTRADFDWLQAQGIEAVRLPVGYWVFGDAAPYSAAIDYVDRVFEWAAATGIYVLLDMHAAPGSQNGWDHSGRAGSVGWADSEQNIVTTLSVVQKLAKRYARHPQLLGIELLNEPKWTLPKSALLRYYKAAYALVRQECGPNVWIVFHDNFRPRRWKRQLRGTGYRNVVMDTHQYQCFNNRDKRLDIAGHLRKTAVKIPRALAAMRVGHAVMVGEWSLALDMESIKDLDGQQTVAAYRAYGAAQLLAYSQSSAWFYWTYRTEEGGVWSYRDAISRGWLQSYSSAQTVRQ